MSINKLYGNIKPLDQDHSSVVAANQELQELSYLDDDDDDMFDEVAHLYMPDDKASIVYTPEFEPESFASPLPVHKTEVSLACVRPELDMDPHFMGQQTSSPRHCAIVAQSGWCWPVQKCRLRWLR
ncbi:hypothetical protein [Acidovorax sp. BLS4]|uniref:hypothetical protein n=1 Tax=Acidovorax sp. BLS4 TaxID=3273430 RepID=UPI00294370C0|nr:hypothetical protein [Paracidovorax avenae]WOI45577.1 hypothetical protein R1Z03_24450 [Paracidovorax avenae]